MFQWFISFLRKLADFRASRAPEPADIVPVGEPGEVPADRTGSRESVKMATITYSTGVPRLSDKWHTYLASLVDQAGISGITVSSTYRSPERQAVAMFANAKEKGAESQLKLYQAPGQTVIRSYMTSKAQGLSDNDTLKVMVNTINQVGGQYISAHLRPPSDKFFVVDIPPWSVPEDRRAAFVSVMKKHASKFLDPLYTPGEPVFHVEFGGVKPIVKTAGTAIIILVAAVIIIYHLKKGGTI